MKFISETVSEHRSSKTKTFFLVTSFSATFSGNIEFSTSISLFEDNPKHTGRISNVVTILILENKVKFYLVK